MSLYYTNELHSWLQDSHDPIARTLINHNYVLTTTVGNFLGVDTSKGHLTYLPAKLVVPYNGDWHGRADGRVGGKPVRIMKKFFKNPDMFTEEQWTAFGLFISSLVDYEKLFTIELVEGEDIRYWYLEDRYADNAGSLNNSCMRRANCQHYFHFYVDNPSICKMLTVRKDDKLHGRTLVWHAENGKVFYDRIYANSRITEIIRRHAQTNGWDSIRNKTRYDKLIPQNIERIDTLPYFDSLELAGKELVRNGY